MLHAGVEDPGEMAGADDQEVVEAFPANGAHPALRERVGVRRPHRRADDLGADGAPHVVERSGELGVAVADHLSDDPPGLLDFDGEVAGLGGSPTPPSGWS